MRSQYLFKEVGHRQKHSNRGSKNKADIQRDARP